MHKNLEISLLRSFVSQIGTKAYEWAKWLNSIIIKYIIKCVWFTKTCKNPKMLASLVVENMFTNVSVTVTIEIIWNNVCTHSDIQPRKFPKESTSVKSSQYLYHWIAFPKPKWWNLPTKRWCLLEAVIKLQHVRFFLQVI